MNHKYSKRPYADFMSEYVPGSDLTKEQLKKVGDLSELLTLKLGGKDREFAMYPIFCNKFNIIQGLARSTDRWKDVADWRETDYIDIRTDLALYPDDARAHLAYDMEPPKGIADLRKPHVARNAWAWMLSFLEAKPDESESGYFFSGDTFLNPTPKGQTARAQNMKYVAEIMLRGHFQFVFSIYVAGTNAAIFRWDRNGVLYATIDLKKDPTHLWNFVFRLAKLKGAKRGLDPTVELASAADIEKLQNHVPLKAQLIKSHKFMLANTTFYPIHKVYCDRPEDSSIAAAPKRRTRSLANSKMAFLIGRYSNGECFPTGRCTRTYIAYDIANDRLVFFKDSWRPKFNAHPEADTYRRLNSAGVTCVATLLAGGDVGAPKNLQCTVSQEYQPDGLYKDFERIHHRVVLEEIGCPIENYPNSMEMMTLVYHALRGHMEAWEKAGVLHRDISLANILIDINSIGGDLAAFLIDWDLCRYREDFEKDVPPSPARSGTWPFLSALLLRYPKKPQDLSDDLEAFVNTVTCLALRFHRHTKSLNYPPGVSGDELRALNGTNSSLMSHVHTYFYQEEQLPGGYWKGGEAKMNVLVHGTNLPIELLPDKDGPVPLAGLIADLFALLREHYETIDFEDMKRYDVAIERPEQFAPPPRLEPPAGHAAPQASGSVTLPTRPLNRLPPRQRRPAASAAPPPTESAPAAPPPPKPKWPAGKPRPLDTHDRILEIFEAVLDDKYGDVFARAQNDRTPDQMDGLQIVLSATDKRSSAATKRQAEHAAERELGILEAFNKRVRVDAGCYLPWDPIAEDHRKPVPQPDGDAQPEAGPSRLSEQGAGARDGKEPDTDQDGAEAAAEKPKARQRKSHLENLVFLD
ncbi:hypothetical protein PsYK624_141050 [Phanerochaete sordida]|uniref:Fungal-type protein kinase domain-containing protein n=1 Tax=Phanerochaete sordida TaxID=48140 RepID=A0A9P3GMX8_9APHY|nr:hypothetical protein PsYK624_141050 [Phanerochaete sordida]